MRSQIVSLQARLLELQAAADSLEENLRLSEQKNAAVLDQQAALSDTVDRAIESLQRQGVRLEIPAQQRLQPQAITLLFQKALDFLERQSSVYGEAGAFFLTDGTEVSGRLLHLGAVATFGISEQGGGALMPAGLGRFKVSRFSQGVTVADKLNRGDGVNPIGAFLYDSLDKAAEERVSRSLIEHIQDGGVIAWVIVALGFLGLIMCLARAGLLMSSVARSGKISEQVIPLVQKGQWQEAVALCPPRRGSAACVLRATLRNLDRERAHLEDIVSEAIMHELPSLERFGSTIMVIVAVAPLLGLLGTVTGMISTFQIITEFGNTNPKLLSGGISVALITTELGLVVAVPLLLFGSVLSSWADSTVRNLEQQALRVINTAFGNRDPADVQNSLANGTAPPGVQTLLAAGPGGAESI